MGGLREVIRKARTGRCNRWNSAANSTLSGNQVADIAAGGGAGRRSAKNAAVPLKQSREAHHPARPLHSPEEGHKSLRQ